MRRIGFKYCALHYLNVWLSVERLRWKALLKGNVNEKLIALSEFAFDYRIARNFSLEYDKSNPIQKYKPALDIIERMKPDQFNSSDVVSSIREVAKQMSKKYGGRGLLSAATKFLWLKMPSKIIIYDSRVRTALGTKHGDLEAYHAAWRKTYKLYAWEIDAACQSLVDVRDYTSDRRIATADYVSDITSKRWFKKRVFDSYLWHRGRISRVVIA